MRVAHFAFAYRGKKSQSVWTRSDGVSVLALRRTTPAKEAEPVTQAERNAAITRKIEAYTAKFTADKKTARDALKREGFAKTSKMSPKASQNAVA